MSQSVSAIFLDRDGTINYDNSYIYKINDFQFIEGAVDAMQELKNMGFVLVVITNQSGLAHGFFSMKQFINLIDWMNHSLANHDVNLDGIYFCPHHPKAVIETLRQECNCRKPKPGMLLSAQYQLNIEMASSYMVGDKLEDMLAAKTVKVGKRVLVRSGKLITQQAIIAADWIIDSLAVLPAMIKQYYSNGNI